jgi:multidrug resistance efflux pump
MNEEDPYSEEAQEVITFVPTWMIRWGNTLIFGIIGTIIFLSWIIKYPDIVSGSFVLSAENNMVKLNTISSGKITKIKSEGTVVSKGEFIAEIENTITLHGIETLNKTIEEVNKILNKPTIKFPEIDSTIVFGEIQLSYSELKKLCLDYQKIISDDNHSKQIEFYRKKINQHKQLALVLKNKIQISENELKNYEDKYNIDKSLYKEKVLSKIDFYKEETFYRTKQFDLENSKASEIQNQMTLGDLERQLYDLEYNHLEKKRNYKENIKIKIDGVRNGIKNWTQNYIVTSPIAGKLTFIRQLKLNQYLNSGETLFAIIPPEQQYIGILIVPSLGLGKVKLHQKVNIKFDKYPYYEFGTIKGEIGKISEIPNKGFYEIEVIIDNKMITTHKKELLFSPDMSGTADIVTEDLRLIERIFNNFRKLTSRKNK